MDPTTSNNGVNNLVTMFPMNNEVWKSDRGRQRARSIIREFALNTSTHAIPGIARSKSIANRIFWSISFISFTGIMVYFIAKSIINYFEYPVQTGVTVLIEQTQIFPAFTFCNHGFFRYDKMIEEYVNYTNSRNITNTTASAPFTAIQAAYLQDFLVEKINAGETIDDSLFTLDTMLIDCNYNSEQCTKADFISFISPSYGFCYTFNAKTKQKNNSRLRFVDENGGIGILTLRLYTHSHLYAPYVLSDVTSGMIGMIHDNVELPLIDIAGMYLSPGKRHKLAYKKKQNNFLTSPYTDCINEIPITMAAMFQRYRNADYSYSQGVCYILCKQAYIYQECGCVSPNQWAARSVVLPETQRVVNAPLCTSSNSCYIDASQRMATSQAIWSEHCSRCKQACKVIDFSIISSTAEVITSTYMSTVKSFVESTNLPLPTNWTSDWAIEIKNNYVAIDVVCQSSMVENLTQEAAISPIDVLSNVGGHTGLWIGISFLSVMEFIEMLFRLVRRQIIKTIGRLDRN